MTDVNAAPVTPAQPAVRRWRNLLRIPRSRSLRFQFTMGVLAVLLPSFALSYVGVNRFAVEEISRLARIRLVDEAGLLSYGLSQWGEANRLMLKSLSFDQALRQRDVAGSSALLRSLHSLYPYRDWRYWSTDPQPKLLAYSHEISPDVRARMEAAILQRGYYRDALNGIPGYGVIKSYVNNKACMVISQPVYRDQAPSIAEERAFLHGDEAASRGDSLAASPRRSASAQRPTGVLVTCIHLEDLGKDTGLQAALSDPRLGNIQGLSGDFSSDRPVDKAFVLISRHGHILYPTERGINELMPTVLQYSQGHWGPLFRLARRSAIGNRESFEKVKIGQDTYFVLINNADRAWSTMLILNEKRALASLHSVLNRLVLFGLLCLLLAVLAVYWQCGRIIAPVRSAGGALQRISEGDFEARVEHGRADEIGQLLDNVNRASEQLKLYLSRETEHAVTRKQLQTARLIQKDFLVSSLPVCDQLELAPIFLPAYEIGADWYDALRIDDTIYVVVADVCDKGIPSALYMSVFRSLLRYGLLAHGGSGDDPSRRLQEVITMVNDYMATNQGDSMMFATVFLGAIDLPSSALHYICAGHELPVVCGDAGLRSLESTGPAVGLFPGAIFQAQRLTLAPGDALVAYTDGLTDARSPGDQGWGREALLDFLAARTALQDTAAELLDALVAAAQAHMAGTAAFDDLTVMVVRRPR